MARAPGADTPHLPHPAPIDAYGNGGFRFAGMSHRGSILCLPDGIWAWPIHAISELDNTLIGPVLARADMLDLFFIGAGPDPHVLTRDMRQMFKDAGLSVDCLATGPAAQTYNILLGEGRRVGAGLIAV